MTGIFILLMIIILIHIFVQHFIRCCKTEELEEPLELENQEAQESQRGENQGIQELQTTENQESDLQLEIQNINEEGETIENQEVEEPQDFQNQNGAENQEYNGTDHYVVNLLSILATFVGMLSLVLGYYFLPFSSRLSLFFHDSFPLISIFFVPYYHWSNPLLRQYVWQSILRHMSSKHPQNNQEELENNLELEIQNWDEIEMESL